jgi:hypothetical protein
LKPLELDDFCSFYLEVISPDFLELALGFLGVLCELAPSLDIFTGRLWEFVVRLEAANAFAYCRSAITRVVTSTVRSALAEPTLEKLRTAAQCIHTADWLIAQTGGGKVDWQLSSEELVQVAAALQDQGSREFGQAAVIAVTWSSVK